MFFLFEINFSSSFLVEFGGIFGCSANTLDPTVIIKEASKSRLAMMSDMDSF